MTHKKHISAEKSMVNMGDCSHPELVELESWLMQQGVFMKHLEKFEPSDDNKGEQVKELCTEERLRLEDEGRIVGKMVIPELIVLGQE